MIKATLDGQPNCYKFTIFTMIIYQEIYQAEHEASDEPNDAPKIDASQSDASTIKRLD